MYKYYLIFSPFLSWAVGGRPPLPSPRYATGNENQNMKIENNQIGLKERYHWFVIEEVRALLH